MTDQYVTNENGLPTRSPPFGPAKVIKKTTGLYKSKRFHCQLLLILSVAILSLIFGIAYFHSCPMQPNITLFLVVQGAAGILLFVINLAATFYILRIDKFKYLFICAIAGVALIITLFLFAWFIAGNVWIFSVTKRVQFTDSTKPNSYCHGTLYHFAFWLLIVQYIIALYFICSFVWMPQSAHSPTNGIIKIRKQIPKIKKRLRGNLFKPTTIAASNDTITTRF